MKRIKYIFAATALLAFLYSGCILDAFNELVQNFSVEQSFIVNGNTSNIPTQSNTFSLDDSDVYDEYKDKLKDISFVAASLRVDSLSNTSVQGDVILTLKNGSGVTLFSHTYSNFKPADYYNTKAQILSLTQAEISLINAYIDITGNRTFTGELQVTNATPANTTVYMKFTLDIAFELTADL